MDCRPRLSKAFFILPVISCLAACEEKKPPVPLAPAASSLAPSTPPPSAMTMKLGVLADSRATIEMPAPKENIKASAQGAEGSLDIDVSDLTRSRGEVKFDLTKLTTATFNDAKKDATQTAHARTWLEVADGEEGKLPDDVKAANRWASFAIRSIESASERDLAKVPVTKDGGEDVRKVSLTAKGELLIHGRKVERDAELDVEFRYASGAPASKPSSVIAKTKKPFRVVLAEHDVKPRDAAGKLAKEAFNLLGTKVADTADIALEVRARPAA